MNFNILPEEILCYVITNLDVKSIISFSETSINANKFYLKNIKLLLYESLSKITKYRINKFNIDMLKSLYKIQTNKSRLSINACNLLMLTETGEVYSFTNNMYGLPEIKESIKYEPIIINGLKNIIQISEGNGNNERYYHSFVLLDSGQVYSSGNNEYGQLGLGDKHNRTQYCQIKELKNHIVSYVVTEKKYSLFLTTEGRVYGVGNNSKGQLGLGQLGLGRRIYKTFTPTIIDELYNVISISIYENHSLALTLDGKVYGFGDNHYLQLGLTNNNYILTPTLIISKNIIQIATGLKYSLALTNNGKVYAFGYNANINSGKGDYFNHIPTLINNLPYIIQISISYPYGLLLDINGNVYKINDNYDTPILIDNLTNIVQLSDRGFHGLWY